MIAPAFQLPVDVPVPDRAELRLLRAILLQALEDAHHRCRCRTTTYCHHRADRHTARRWLTADSGAPFSFAYCCETLQLDPEAVRHRWRPATRRHRTIRYNRSREVA